MKKAKILTAMLLTLAMVFTLAACASTGSEATDPPASTQTPKVSPTPKPSASAIPPYVGEMLDPTTPGIREGVKHIACIGDSITWGAGVIIPDMDFESTYPVFLEAELGEDYQVLNYGMSGKTLLKEGDNPYTEAKFYDISHEAGADIYIIMLGTNDSKPYNWNAELYREELEAFVRSYMELPSNPQIYVMTPPRAFIVDGAEEEVYDIKNDTICGEAAPIVREVAELLDVNLIDMYAETENHPEWFPDGVHPGAEGNVELAKIVAAHLNLN